MAISSGLLRILSFSVLLLVLCSDESNADEKNHLPEPVPKPEVYFLHIHSDIKFRYAQTLITSRVVNPANVSQEVVFHVVLPETAFISGFVMTIKEKDYVAYVKEKEKAKEEYTQAVAAGQTAAHIEYSARDSNQFVVSVNIEPQTKVTFNLTYEELLERTLAHYRHEININPGQIVKDMKVEVNIEDATPIVHLKVPDLRMANEITEEEKDNALARITTLTPNKIRIEWAPTTEEQKKIKEEGIKGQFIVQYDVDRSKNPQQVLVDEGYFVHFFSQDDLPPLNKHVVFVLDLSGSMFGRKLAQVKEAMNSILSDLNANDYFSLVLFSDTAKAWAPKKVPTFSYAYSPDSVKSDEELTADYIVPASNDNIANAKNFTEGLNDLGGTNIIAGLRMGIKLTKIGKDLLSRNENKPEPILIFLTDGEPNVEMSDPNEITKAVKSLNTLKSKIFSLGFGDGADLKFLRKLSLTNSGFARNIYEGSDASLQLKNFFKEVASPLLSNITFEYVPGQVDNETTDTQFSTLFSGSELVVAGKLVGDNLSGVLSVTSASGFQKIPFPKVIKSIIIDHIPLPPTPINRTFGHLERLWAYKTISQLLDKNLVDKKAEYEGEALELALKYSFVTPLTSLVVVKPNETTAVDAEKSSPPNQFSYAQPSLLIGGAPGMMAGLPGGSGGGSGGGLGGGFAASGGGFAASGFMAPNYQTFSQIGGTPHPPVLHATYTHPRPVFTTTPSGGAGGSFQVDSSRPAFPGPPPIPSYTPTTEKSELDAEVSEDFKLKNITDVIWLQNGTVNSDGYLLPPATVSSDFINLNAIGDGLYDCKINGTSPGSCKHFVHCILDIFCEDESEFTPYQCHIEPSFLGVCCPL